MVLAAVENDFLDDGERMVRALRHAKGELREEGADANFSHSLTGGVVRKAGGAIIRGGRGIVRAGSVWGRRIKKDAPEAEASKLLKVEIRLERPVHNGKTGGKFFGEIGEPRV